MAERVARPFSSTSTAREPTPVGSATPICAAIVGRNVDWRPSVARPATVRSPEPGLDVS